MDVWENRFALFRNKEWMLKEECSNCKVWELCKGGAMHLRDDTGKMLGCSYLKLRN